MSKFEFKLPDIGEGVTEGEIVSWLVAVGDSVNEDQDIVEVMTDKATVTIGAPKAGAVAELKGDVGDVIPVGETLVVLDLDGSGAAEAPASGAGGKPQPEASAKEAPPKETAASAVGDIKEELPGTAAASGGGKPLAAPATRKLARELGVDLAQVPPTGPGSRITREDVQAFAAGGAPAAAPSSAKGAPAPKAPAPLPSPAPAVGDERVPIRGMRRLIFENMARSKRTAAHFTYVEECEASALMALRSRLKPHADAEGVRLNFLPFIVKAVVAALKRNPTLNALVDEEKGELVLKKTYDIGIAAATDAGLIVPVLRHADRLSLIEISNEIERLATDARHGKTRREDLGGASFTITSLGKLGGYFATPVLHHPEVGILYVPQIKKKPVVKGDEIVVGNVMNLAVSFDHRVIDGHVGAAFAQDVVALLENPDKLLLHQS